MKSWEPTLVAPDTHLRVAIARIDVLLAPDAIS